MEANVNITISVLKGVGGYLWINVPECKSMKLCLGMINFFMKGDAGLYDNQYLERLLESLQKIVFPNFRLDIHPLERKINIMVESSNNLYKMIGYKEDEPVRKVEEKIFELCSRYQETNPLIKSV